MELGPFWLVPSMEFEKRANVLKQGEILRITASMKTGTRDKWSEFQFVRKDLAMKISQLGSAVGQMPFRRIDRSGGAAQLLEVHPALRPDRGADGGVISKRSMLVFWLAGIEDRPERSGEICVAEIFGDVVRDGVAQVGMGFTSFATPS
ncbi:hypothetical protein BH23CHL4_BH23CHL4_10600 [soil metagenome]